MAIGASFIWYPHLSPLQGESFILRVPRVKTRLKPWAKGYSPFFGAKTSQPFI
jgi:hypothetical protein